MEQNGAVHEGRAAFILGSNTEANPYHKAKVAMGNGDMPYDDARYAGLMDLACQWDSGWFAEYAIARRAEEVSA